MYSTALFPNFRKLHDYFQEITDTQIAEIESAKAVPIELDYMNEADYLRVSEGLKSIVNTYQLEDHYNELLYLIIKKNEQLKERYDAIWQNYEDDSTSKEIAKFILAYKTSNSKQDFHLTAKTALGNVTLKDSAISRWMVEVVCKQIEEGNFPIHLFGEKFAFDIFGGVLSGNVPISIEHLETVANHTPRSPVKRLRKLYVELCLYLQVYLINQTSLTAPESVLLTDAQANFFFDVLELLGYLNREKIESPPDDYIHSMFRNHMRLND